MRGYIDLNKSDPCVKNLEKTFFYIDFKNEEKALYIITFAYTIIAFILTIIVEVLVYKSIKGDLSDDGEKCVGFSLVSYFVILICYSIMYIISSPNIALIYRDFDECIIPNIKKEYNFSKFKKFLLKVYPTIHLIICIEEIVDKFSDFLRIFGKVCRCGR